MRLFRLPSRNAKRMDKETPAMRFIRYTIIALLFCAVLWGFWINNQRRMQMLRKDTPSENTRTGSLDSRQIRQLAGIRAQPGHACGPLFQDSATRAPALRRLRTETPGDGLNHFL